MGGLLALLYYAMDLTTCDVVRPERRRLALIASALTPDGHDIFKYVNVCDLRKLFSGEDCADVW